MAAPDPDGTRVVTVCTGNVARSVMLAAMLESLTGRAVESRGTLVIEGKPVSARIVDAYVAATGLDGAALRAHRSRQLSAEDLDGADLVLCAEADHVAAVRRLRPDAPVATVGQLARAVGDLPARLAASASPDPSVDVPDPGSGDQALYERVARLLWDYAREVAPLL